MFKRFAWCFVIAVNFLLMASASAQLIDDIEVRAVGSRAEVTIKLAAQIRLVRNAVSANGKTLEVFFQITQSDEAVARIVEEARKSPPNSPVVPFTVSYSPLNQTGIRRLDVVFSQSVKPTIRLGGNGRSLLLTLPSLQSPAERATVVPAAPATAVTPAPAKAAEAVPPSPTPEPPAVVSSTPPTALASAETRSILERAKKALDGKDYDTALAQFNILLNLPQNETTLEAQELIGAARVGLGQTKAARAEYEMFLKLYPTSDGATRVRQRLLELDRAPTVASTQTGKSKPSSTTLWGSVSQSYYGGQSRIDTSTIIVTPATNATTIDQQTITGTDQSSLVTNLDLNARIRSGDWETRMSVRDTYTASFLKNIASRNRLTAAYADVKNQADHYGVRLGRQSPTGAGVLYRFDGISGNYAFSPTWKVNFVAGTPSDVTPGERKAFYGASVDAEGILPNLGATVYAIEQRAGSYSDRRAFGTELRYNTERVNTIGTFDYDVLFRRVNIGSVQATYNVPDTITFNALYDFRASPPLQLTNGMAGVNAFTLADLMGQVNLRTAKEYASALTATSRVASLGFTVPFAKTWQAGLDYRISSVSGTGATPALPASEASGQIKTVTGQLIASSVWGPSDVFVVNGSYLSAPTYNGWLIALNPRFVIASQWTVEPVVRWFRQVSTNGQTLTRWSPSLRGSYRWSEKIYIDAEASWELSRSNSASVNQNSNHLFYYIGYRYDF